jgi:hypothetical protein
MEDAGHKIIKADQFRLDAKPYVIGSQTGDLKDPEISVRKENDRITGIDVKCTCGRVIHIDCS